jgi:hypothetical protein
MWEVINWGRNLLNLKHNDSLLLKQCTEDDSKFVGMGEELSILKAELAVCSKTLIIS